MANHIEHRIVQFTEPDGSTILVVHEVYFTGSKPHSFSVNPSKIMGDDTDEIAEVAKAVSVGLLKPVLIWDETTKSFKS